MRYGDLLIGGAGHDMIDGRGADEYSLSLTAGQAVTIFQCNLTAGAASPGAVVGAGAPQAANAPAAVATLPALRKSRRSMSVPGVCLEDEV